MRVMMFNLKTAEETDDGFSWPSLNAPNYGLGDDNETVKDIHYPDEMLKYLVDTRKGIHLVTDGVSPKEVPAVRKKVDEIIIGMEEYPLKGRWRHVCAAMRLS